MSNNTETKVVPVKILIAYAMSILASISIIIWFQDSLNQPVFITLAGVIIVGLITNKNSVEKVLNTKLLYLIIAIEAFIICLVCSDSKYQVHDPVGLFIFWAAFVIVSYFLKTSLCISRDLNPVRRAIKYLNIFLWISMLGLILKAYSPDIEYLIYPTLTISLIIFFKLINPSLKKAWLDFKNPDFRKVFVVVLVAVALIGYSFQYKHEWSFSEFIDIHNGIGVFFVTIAIGLLTIYKTRRAKARMIITSSWVLLTLIVYVFGFFFLLIISRYSDTDYGEGFGLALLIELFLAGLALIALYKIFIWLKNDEKIHQDEMNLWSSRIKYQKSKVSKLSKELKYLQNSDSIIFCNNNTKKKQEMKFPKSGYITSFREEYLNEVLSMLAKWKVGVEFNEKVSKVQFKIWDGEFLLKVEQGDLTLKQECKIQKLMSKAFLIKDNFLDQGFLNDANEVLDRINSAIAEEDRVEYEHLLKLYELLYLANFDEIKDEYTRGVFTEIVESAYKAKHDVFFNTLKDFIIQLKVKALHDQNIQLFQESLTLTVALYTNVLDLSPQDKSKLNKLVDKVYGRCCDLSRYLIPVIFKEDKDKQNECYLILLDLHKRLLEQAIFKEDYDSFQVFLDSLLGLELGDKYIKQSFYAIDELGLRREAIIFYLAHSLLHAKRVNKIDAQFYNGLSSRIKEVAYKYKNSVFELYLEQDKINNELVIYFLFPRKRGRQFTGNSGAMIMMPDTALDYAIVYLAQQSENHIKNQIKNSNLEFRDISAWLTKAGKLKINEQDSQGLDWLITQLKELQKEKNQQEAIELRCKELDKVSVNNFKQGFIEAYKNIQSIEWILKQFNNVSQNFDNSNLSTNIIFDFIVDKRLLVSGDYYSHSEEDFGYASAIAETTNKKLQDELLNNSKYLTADNWHSIFESSIKTENLIIIGNFNAIDKIIGFDYTWAEPETLKVFKVRPLSFYTHKSIEIPIYQGLFSRENYLLFLDKTKLGCLTEYAYEEANTESKWDIKVKAFSDDKKLYNQALKKGVKGISSEELPNKIKEFVLIAIGRSMEYQAVKDCGYYTKFEGDEV